MLPSSTLTSDQPPDPPPLCWGGGRERSTVNLPGPPPSRLPQPWGCRPASRAGYKTADPPHSPPFCLGRLSTWASVARGDVGVGAGASTCPRQQPAVPAVTAADFTALFDSCLAGGLKARLVFSAVAGGQTLTLSCHLPVPALTTAVARKRGPCCRHRRRRKRGRAAISAPEDQAHVSPLIPSNPAAPTPPQASPLWKSPEIAPPPAKKTGKDETSWSR